jgi:RNA polymerase sigma-70 factor (ECF subfamily)
MPRFNELFTEMNGLKNLNAAGTWPVISGERGSRMMEVPLDIAFQEQALAEEEGANRDERFAALVTRQARFVFRVAYSVLRNVHDAEDAVQETFLKLYRGRKWEGMVDERAFLARAAWRIAVDRLSKARIEETDADIPARGENPEQAAMTADWNATVHRLIDALPEELRQPLALSAVEELQSGEIAAVMSIPEGTVRTRLMRAREILKQKLGALREGRHGK